MKNELAELVADALAVVEHNRLRGAANEPIHSEPVPVIPADDADPASESGANAAGWAALASEARSDAPGGTVTLQGIRADLGDCQRCGLCNGRSNIVFGVGAPKADLMIIGEAPGFHEDQQGEPFVGNAGQLLDRMLAGVFGLDRNEVYIANIVKCRPPGNRNPEPEEVASCLPFLIGQIQAVSPKVIVVLGSVALKNLFQTNQGIMRNRGTWKTYRGIPAMATFHPAYLLRNPEAKRDCFNDLKSALAKYNELGGKRTKPSPY